MVRGKWINEIRTHVKDATVILLGLYANEETERLVSYEEASSFAKKINGKIKFLNFNFKAFIFDVKLFKFFILISFLIISYYLLLFY